MGSGREGGGKLPCSWTAPSFSPSSLTLKQASAQLAQG